MRKSIRSQFETGYAAVRMAKRQHPDPVKSLKDARAFADAAHKKAAEYLRKGEALLAENNDLRRELKEAYAQAERERAQSKTVESGLNHDIVAALRMVLENPKLIPFVMDAIRPGSKIDYLAKTHKVPRTWAESARRLWRKIDDHLGLVNAENQQRPTRIQQGDRISARARAH